MRPRESRSWLGNPMVRSGLAFAGARTWLGSIWASEEENGLLTSEEVLGLDLSGTELTVLSACDSARGDSVPGEGVFGLRRAFTVAGSQTLIMSCWPILDAVTSELMDELYERLLDGKGRAAALRFAQEKIKQDYPDPYYWGSFVCLGQPGPLATQIRLPVDEAF
jgi:CHAT domain-containing protein